MFTRQDKDFDMRYNGLGGSYSTVLGFLMLSVVLATLTVFGPTIIELTNVPVGSYAVWIYSVAAALLMFVAGVAMGCYFLYVTRSVNFLFGTWGMIAGLIFVILAYAMAYYNAISVFGGECLVIDNQTSDDTVYFAVVTLTTLGYGDIRPVGPCRWIAGSEALLGVIFLPMIVAFFVGSISRLDNDVEKD